MDHSKKVLIVLALTAVLIFSSIGAAVFMYNPIAVNSPTSPGFIPDASGSSDLDEGQEGTYSIGISGMLNDGGDIGAYTATFVINGDTQTQSWTPPTGSSTSSHTYTFHYTFSSSSGSSGGTAYSWTLKVSEQYNSDFASGSGTTYVYTDPSLSSISVSSTVDAGQSATFTANGAAGGVSPYTYYWYFSGTEETSTSDTYSYAFSGTGPYTVAVYIADSSDAGAVDSNNVSMSYSLDSDPSISITSSLNPSDVGQSATFSTSVSGGSGGYTYSYDLYDGDSASDSVLASGTASQVSYQFTSSGSYLLTYSVTDSNGYTTSTSLTQTVNTDPSVSITSSQNPTDAGNTITLTASASGGTGSYSYQWYESGSAISGATSSTYSASFSASGTYDFYVAVTDGAGYTVDSSTLAQTVNSDPTVAASSNVSSADVGYPIEFSASPSGGTAPYTYSWTIGGTQESTSQDFSYSFSSAGSYTVEVTVTDSVGQSYSASVTVTINNNPSVSISSSQNPTDVGNSVTFTASESGGTGTISYAWYVNGASEGSGSTLSYTFSSAGSFTIEVEVDDSDSHTDTYSLSEIVYPDPVVTVINSLTPGVFYVFSYLSGPTEGAVPYSDISSYPLEMIDSEPNNISSWTGTFVDGGFGFDYGNPGYSGDTYLGRPVEPFPSSLSVLNTEPGGGADDEGFMSVTILYFTGGTYTFYGEFDDNGAIFVSNNGVNWTSVLGDNAWHSEGATAYDGTETLTAGWYFVAVDAGNMGGGPSVSALNITGGSISTSGTPPIVGSTDAGIRNFFLSAVMGGSDSYSYSWTANGNTYTAPAFNTTFSSGSYPIDLKITDGASVSESASVTETVNADPSVSISSSQNPTDVGNSVTFTATESGGTGTLSYQWYENGSAISGATSSTYSTSFSSSGTYDIYVIVTDGIGETAQSSTIDETVNPDPAVSISSSQNPTDVGNTVTFTASGSDGTGALSYTWYLNGATQSSTSSEFSYSFSSSGVYYINVTVKDTLGDTASYSLEETVNPDPSVTITSSQNPTDTGNSITFTASESGGTGTLSYQWYENGSAISGATSSTYSTSFKGGGTYDIYVIVKDSLGNTAQSSTIDETVNPDPVVSISSSQNPTDIGNSVTFTASASYGTGSYSYQWYWSNGTAIPGATSSTYTTSFSASGSYSFYVIVKDSLGNSAQSSTLTETVNTDPSVTITSSQNPTDVGNTVTFTASASGGSGSYSYQWYWSNGTAISGATGYEYSTSFSASGSYDLYVIVKDANGNTATSSTIDETVNPDPSVTVSESPSPTDTGVSVEFTSTPSGGTGSFNYTWVINGVNYYTHDVNLTFSTQGTYSASVTVRDVNGNTASASETIVVNHQPEVYISVEYDPVYAGTNDLFSASGSYGSGAYNYTWYLNDTTIIGYGVSLKYNFSAPDTYTIEVEIRDGLDQTNTSSVLITVKAKPDVSIAGPINIDYGITNYWGAVINGSIAGGTVYWYIDNINQTSDANDIEISLDYENVSISSLPIEIIYFFDGVHYDYTIDVSIHNPPSVSISAEYSSIDAGVPDVFKPTVTGGSPGLTYSWTIDGTAISAENVSYAFATPGTYTVSLKITDGDGATASATTSITVNSDPSITAAASTSQADTGFSVTFSASPSGGTSPYSYQWYWSNGTEISGATSSSYTGSFTSPGTYNIYAIITDSFGLTAKSNVVSILIVNPPVAIASSNRTSLDSGQSASFSSGIVNGTAPYSYSWTVNGVSVSNTSAFIYTFTSAGTYKVNLTITDKDGYTSTAAITITVYSDPAVSLTYVYSTLDEGSTDDFTASASGGLSPYTYEWYVNGNYLSSSSRFNYTFSGIGTYIVSVDVKDSNGFTVSENLTVTVNALPAVSISAAHTSIDIDISDSFSASVIDGTSPYNYTWYVNGNIAGYGDDLSYTFTSPGTYTVSVTVRDAIGDTTTSQVTIEAYSLPASSILASANETDVNGKITFTGGVSNGVSPYNYTWTIDGDIVSYSTSFSYEFTAPGTYYVNLTITDAFGERSVSSAKITVLPLPTVSISASHSAIDIGQSITFTPSISGGIGPYAYLWTISGIGAVSTQSIFSYSFSSSGTYTINLTITDADGNHAYAIITVVVNPALKASLSVQYPTVDENISDNVTLSAVNGTGPYTYAIFINGAKVSESASYGQFFTSPGTYYIIAYVNDSSGSSAELTATITVRSNPTVVIESPVNETDANVPITFRPILTGGTGPYTYSWLYAGHTSNLTEPIFTFSSPGNYTVQLTVTDEFGREAISSFEMSVYPDLHATLVAPSYIRASVEEQLGLNVSGGITPYRYAWIFPGGEQFTGRNISYAFSTSGPNTFEVQISDKSGYVDVQNFTVNVHLYVAIAANVTEGMGPLAVQFSSSVLGGSDYAFNWTFSPDHYSLAQNPSYVFPVGNYTVHFDVTSANGATGQANISVESLPAPVSFIYSTGLNITQPFDFRAIPNWDASGPYAMSWSFPNGQTLTGLNISYTFPIYAELNTVIATFSYDNGSRTWTQYLTVRMIPAIPIISFTPPPEIPIDTLLSLNATAAAPDSSTFTYLWDINGTSESGQSVLYYFDHAGYYNISVTVTDGLGASQTAYAMIHVLPVGKNTSIVITSTKNVIGAMNYYTVKVESTDGITAFEAFLGTSLLTYSEVNSTYTAQGEIAYFNITLDERDYTAGVYSIDIVVFNNASQSNSISIPFSVNSEYGASGFSIGSIIQFFGGTSNFLIIVLTLGGLVIAYASLRRQDNPDVIVEGLTAKGKQKKVVLKGKK